MNGDLNIHVLAARQSRKRPHHEMLGSHPPSQSSSPWDHAEPSTSNNNYRLPLPAQHPAIPPIPYMRFPGNGYDFRRPIMATTSAPTFSPPPLPHQQNIIDLTDEPDNPLSDQPPRTPPRQRPGRIARPPRFGRNIMADVVDLEAGSSSTNEPQQFSSPEVQFLGTTVRPPLTRSNDIAPLNREGPPPLRGSSLMDMIRRIRGNGPPSYFRRQDALREEIGLRTRNLARAYPTNIAPFWVGERPQVDIDEDFPVELDYTAAGITPGETQQSPAYTAPEAPPPGFTRTVGESEVVVCPNCDHELGTGGDLQRQIWVAKPCGHVYCGQCTRNRAMSRKRSDNTSPSKTKPFSKCVVPDCGKPISQPRAMFQIYL
ncbi:hypothetical protein ACO22_02422 [Paracoccidioides brasiliensis]|nr:hypothetical protein ACO22_02422 [Paracoccidioides brasiliensis]